MNTCQAPQLKMSLEHFRKATTELFFASEQTCVVFSYATLNECRFMQCVSNIHKVVTALFDCYMAIATAAV